MRHNSCFHVGLYQNGCDAIMLLTTFNVAIIVKIQHSTYNVIKHQSDLLKRFRSTSEASTVL